LAADWTQGCQLVVLEPSCASVFRDELHNLFPHQRARHQTPKPNIPSQRVSAKKCTGLSSSPKLSTKVLLHGHCHQKALMKMNHEEALLRSLGCGGAISRFRMLWNGRTIRVSERTSLRCHKLWENESCCGGAECSAGHINCRGWLQLPRAWSFKARGKPAIHLAEGLEDGAEAQGLFGSRFALV